MSESMLDVLKPPYRDFLRFALKLRRKVASEVDHFPAGPGGSILSRPRQCPPRRAGDGAPRGRIADRISAARERAEGKRTQIGQDLHD